MEGYKNLVELDEEWGSGGAAAMEDRVTRGFRQEISSDAMVAIDMEFHDDAVLVLSGGKYFELKYPITDDDIHEALEKAREVGSLLCRPPRRSTPCNSAL